ncbi:MAG: hypothetical protein NWF14_05245, partial [Candidatus Bathyarchaeota archaeon]|nr:hypothetical protein [Candidatus Bathyarchaeota archaeon]
MVSKKALEILLLVTVVAVATPLGYITAQRLAASSCTIRLDRAKITDASMPEPFSLFDPKIVGLLLSTGEGFDAVYPPLSTPIRALNLTDTLEQFLKETQITVDLFFKAVNPSFLAVQINRTEISLTVNSGYFDTVYITRPYAVPS